MPSGTTLPDCQACTLPNAVVSREPPISSLALDGSLALARSRPNPSHISNHSCILTHHGTTTAPSLPRSSASPLCLLSLLPLPPSCCEPIGKIGEATQYLLRPKGFVKFTTDKLAVLQFQGGGTPPASKTAVLWPEEAGRPLAGRDVLFEIVPSSRKTGKFEAHGVRLCDAKEATGKIKAYNPIKGFGFVAGKDGAETLVHYSQVTDFGDVPVTLRRGDKVEFEVHSGPKGPLAINVRQATRPQAGPPSPPPSDPQPPPSLRPVHPLPREVP